MRKFHPSYLFTQWSVEGTNYAGDDVLVMHEQNSTGELYYSSYSCRKDGGECPLCGEQPRCVGGEIWECKCSRLLTQYGKGSDALYPR